MSNCFRLPGYEADDIIASIVRNDQDSELVIYSSDADCFQLLQSGRVTQWLIVAKHELTEEEFTEMHGIPPVQWASRKPGQVVRPTISRVSGTWGEKGYTVLDRKIQGHYSFRKPD